MSFNDTKPQSTAPQPISEPAATPTPPQLPKQSNLLATLVIAGLVCIVILMVGQSVVEKQPAPVAAAPAPTPTPVAVLPQPVAAPVISASVVYADVADSSAKTQIELRAVLSTPLDKVTPAEIESFLRGVFADKPRWDSYMTVDRREREYMLRDLEQSFGDLSWMRSATEIKRGSSRQQLTHFYVMLYPTKDDAKSLSAWVGRLAWREGTQPEIMVREEKLLEARNPDVKIGGLNREKRKEVFKQIIPCGAEGFRVADAQYPNDAMKQIEVSRKVSAACRQRVAKKYKLTTEHLEAISTEGARMSWPMD